MKGRAIRFLFATAVAWSVARALYLWPSRPAPAPPIAWAEPLPRAEPRTARPGVAAASRGHRRRALPAAPRRDDRPAPARPPPASPVPQPPGPPADATAVGGIAAAPPRTPRARAIRVSGWLLLRPDRGRGALAAGGQLGGSQAGIRATIPLAKTVALAVRASAPLGSAAGREAALGVETRLGALPVTLAIERRFGLARGAADRWALLAFGGASAHPIAPGVALDVYAQAGLVGAARPRAFADGAAVATVRLGRRGFAGIGGWAGAQPGLARLDLGPTLGLRLGPARVALDWRARIAGRARPAGNVALTLGADF